MSLEQEIGLTPEELSYGVPLPKEAPPARLGETAAHRQAAKQATAPAAGTPSAGAPPAAVAAGLEYRVKACRHGQFLYNARDIYIGRSLDLYGEYGEVEVQFLTKLAKPGDMVVEAGANIGADTVPLARHLGPQGWLLAVEPQRLVHQTLCANVAMNGLANVVTPWCALGAEPGVAVVPPLDYARAGNYGGIALRRDGAGERVPVATIDSFELPRCALIKADVEGMELEVLKGAAATIARHQPRLYLENNGGAGSPALISHLLGLGYRLFWHTPPLFNPRNFAGNANNVFGNTVSCNMLGLPKGDGAEIRNMRAVSGPDDVALQAQRQRRETPAGDPA